MHANTERSQLHRQTAWRSGRARNRGARCLSASGAEAQKARPRSKDARPGSLDPFTRCTCAGPRGDSRARAFPPPRTPTEIRFPPAARLAAAVHCLLLPRRGRLSRALEPLAFWRAAQPPFAGLSRTVSTRVLGVEGQRVLGRIGDTRERVHRVCGIARGASHGTWSARF